MSWITNYLLVNFFVYLFDTIFLLFFWKNWLAIRYHFLWLALFLFTVYRCATRDVSLSLHCSTDFCINEYGSFYWNFSQIKNKNYSRSWLRCMCSFFCLLDLVLTMDLRNTMWWLQWKTFMAQKMEWRTDTSNRNIWRSSRKPNTHNRTPPIWLGLRLMSVLIYIK